MTLTRRKKLIEVALPLKKINQEASREKSIRHGHPSTLTQRAFLTNQVKSHYQVLGSHQ